MIIDWHSHWIPAEMAERIARHRELPVAREFFDVDARLRFMDSAGITRQVISWPTTFGLDAALPLSEVAQLYREFNDRLAALVGRLPERFSGLAAVPAADPKTAAGELERARSGLGLIGAVVPADAFLTPTGAAAFRPLLAQASRLKCHLYVHPGPTGLPAPDHDAVAFLRVDKGSARWLLETGTRLGAAALTLETGGVLDDYPDVSVHVAMLGGHLGWIAETLAERARKGGSEPRGVSPLQRIFVDTGILKPGGGALALAVSAFGADRILFGSDFPQFGTPRPMEALRSCGLPEGVQARILHGNGSDLLDRIA